MTRLTFPPAMRIKKGRDYQAAQKNGLRYKGKNLTIICHKTTSNEPRLGIAVSKKLGKACQRNRAKRIVREYYRINQKCFADKGDTIIIWKTRIVKPTMKEISAEIANLVKNASLVKNTEADDKR